MAINPGIKLSLRAVRQKTLEKSIRGALVKKVNNGLSNIEKILTVELRDSIRDAIRESPEYISLTTATLRGEFGLENAESKIESIIETFVHSFSSRIKLARTSGNTFFANLSIDMKVDFNRLANHPQGFQEASNSNSNIDNSKADKLLPWLRWLLIEGTSPLVLDYSVVRDKGTGRSGLQFLMESSPGQHYFISKPQFTGVENSNFLTRAINKNSKKIENLIRKRSSELLRKSFGI